MNSSRKRSPVGWFSYSTTTCKRPLKSWHSGWLLTGGLTVFGFSRNFYLYLCCSSISACFLLSSKAIFSCSSSSVWLAGWSSARNCCFSCLFCQMFDAQGVLESVATVLGFWNDPLSGCNAKADIANKKVIQITIVNQASHPGGGGARARARVLSPFPRLVSPPFFVNFSPALYYRNAWNRLFDWKKLKLRKWLIWSLNSFQPVAFLFHIIFRFSLFSLVHSWANKTISCFIYP